MTQLKITGMTCDSCAAHVKEALEKVKASKRVGRGVATPYQPLSRQIAQAGKVAAKDDTQR